MNIRLRGVPALKPLYRIWDGLEFALFRPTPEKFALFGTLLLVFWRWVHYNVTGNPATPIFPEALIGVTIRIPVLPLASMPWLGWYLVMASIGALMIVAHQRTYSNRETRTRDNTWAPMFYYAWAMLIIFGLFTTY